MLGFPRETYTILLWWFCKICNLARDLLIPESRISIENEDSIVEKLNLRRYPFDWKSQGEIIIGTDGLKKASMI